MRFKNCVEIRIFFGQILTGEFLPGFLSEVFGGWSGGLGFFGVLWRESDLMVVRCLCLRGLNQNGGEFLKNHAVLFAGSG